MLNTILFSHWFVILFRFALSFIDLQRFLLYFRIGLLFLYGCVGSRAPFWFVNLDMSVERYVQYGAAVSGEFSVTSNWIGGLISNYSNVVPSFLKKAKEKWERWTNKQFKKAGILNDSFYNRMSWPRSSFFSSIFSSGWAAVDARYGRCPVIGVVDTNTMSHMASWPVPSSDDSYFTIVFLSDLIAGQILLRKYIYFCVWLSSFKRPAKIVRFYSWISKLFRSIWSGKKILKQNKIFSHWRVKKIFQDLRQELDKWSLNQDDLNKISRKKEWYSFIIKNGKPNSEELITKNYDRLLPIQRSFSNDALNFLFSFNSSPFFKKKTVEVFESEEAYPFNIFTFSKLTVFFLTYSVCLAIYRLKAHGTKNWRKFLRRKFFGKRSFRFNFFRAKPFFKKYWKIKFKFNLRYKYRTGYWRFVKFYKRSRNWNWFASYAQEKFIQLLNYKFFLYMHSKKHKNNNKIIFKTTKLNENIKIFSSDKPLDWWYAKNWPFNRFNLVSFKLYNNISLFLKQPLIWCNFKNWFDMMPKNWENTDVWLKNEKRNFKKPMNKIIKNKSILKKFKNKIKSSSLNNTRRKGLNKKWLIKQLKYWSADINWLSKERIYWVNNKTWLITKLANLNIGSKFVWNFLKSLGVKSNLLFSESGDFAYKYTDLLKHRKPWTTSRFNNSNIQSLINKRSDNLNIPSWINKHFDNLNMQNEIYLNKSLEKLWYNISKVISWPIKWPVTWRSDPKCYTVDEFENSLRIPYRRRIKPAPSIFGQNLFSIKHFKRYSRKFSYPEKKKRFIHCFILLLAFCSLSKTNSFKRSTYFPFFLRSSLFLHVGSFFFHSFRSRIYHKFRIGEQLFNNSNYTNFFKSKYDLMPIFSVGSYWYSLFALSQLLFENLKLSKLLIKKIIIKPTYFTINGIRIGNVRRLFGLDQNLYFNVYSKLKNWYQSFLPDLYFKRNKKHRTWKFSYKLVRLLKLFRPFWYFRIRFVSNRFFRRFWYIKGKYASTVVYGAKFVHFWI